MIAGMMNEMNNAKVPAVVTATNCNANSTNDQDAYHGSTSPTSNKMLERIFGGSPTPFNKTSTMKEKKNSTATSTTRLGRPQRVQRGRSKTISPVRQKSTRRIRASLSPLSKRRQPGAGGQLWNRLCDKMEETTAFSKKPVAFDFDFKNLQEELKGDLRDAVHKGKVEFHAYKNLFQQDLNTVADLGRQLKTRAAKNNYKFSSAASRQQQHQQQQQSTRKQLLEQLRSYEQDIRSPAFRETLNSMMATKCSSCQEMIDYYQARPELKEYTLTKELPRMNYTILTEDGRRLRSHKDEPIEEIVQYAYAQQQQQQQQQDDTTITTNTKTNPNNIDLIWRAANQSLLGDVICALTEEGENGLIRPQWSTATFVDDVTMTLDFYSRNASAPAPAVTAEFFININLPSPTAGGEQQRLSLAGVVVNVHFCPSLQQLQSQIYHISPSPLLSQADAEYIVEQQLASYE